MFDEKIFNLNWYVFMALVVVIIGAIFLNVLPNGMIGAFLFLMIMGGALNFIGNHAPIIKTYLGGGAIVAIFAGAAMVYYGIIPKTSIDMVNSFMKSGKGSMGFLDFYIAALITGSILGMSRELLIKASVRYLPTIIGGVICALAFVALAAPIVGFSSGEAMAYIGIPIMGGGMGAGAVPISEIFSKALNIPVESILGKLVPAVALGNAVAIVMGGLLNRLGKIKPNWTGEGNLMISDDDSLKSKDKVITMDASDYGAGIVTATGFFTCGAIIAFLFKKVGIDLHTYAWMIILVAVIKIFDIMPEKICDVCAGWYKFVAENFTAALLLGIGIAYTSLGDIIHAFSIQYVFLVILVVLGAVVGSAIVGRLVGFYPIEAAITAGLCMANMGGTGDVAVLTAANRMSLMPFAQISSRLGGAFIILFASLLVPLFF